MTPVVIVAGRCPICRVVIPTDRLLCGRHWMRVSKAHKDAVLTTWEEYQRGLIDLAELRGVQRAAVEQVQARLVLRRPMP